MTAGHSHGMGVFRRYGRTTTTLNATAAVLFALTAIRILTVCLSQPIAAYANNYDFVRQSSCVGVWQTYDDRDKTASNPDRPVDRITYDADRRPKVCLPSSDNAFPWILAQVSFSGVPTELRWVGALKAAMTLTLLGFVLLQPIPARVRCGLATVGLLVFGDFAIGLYFDTLYLEASVIISLTVGACLAVAALCRTRQPGAGFAVLVIWAAVWLTFARQQYSPVALLTAGAAVLICLTKWRARASAAAIFAAVCVAQVGFHYIQAHPSEHTRQVDKANRTDVFLGAVIPAARNPDAALERAGLPASCAPTIGDTWYSPGFQKANPCPAVYDVSRTRLLGLFVHEPRTLALPLLRVAWDSQMFLLPYLGHFERPADSARIRFRLLRLTSLSTWLSWLPSVVYVALLALTCAASPLCMVAAFAPRHREALLMAGLGGVITLYALLSSVFGDGYYEVQRHAVAVLIGLSLFIGAAVIATSTSLCSDRHCD